VAAALRAGHESGETRMETCEAGRFANYVPGDPLYLETEVEMSLDALRTKPDLLRHCFHGAKLEL